MLRYAEHEARCASIGVEQFEHLISYTSVIRAVMLFLKIIILTRLDIELLLGVIG